MQLHISLRRIGGNSMDIQLVIVSLIVLAAVGYTGLARKESSKGSVLLRMWRLRKELQAEDALSRPKEYIILGDTL